MNDRNELRPIVSWHKRDALVRALTELATSLKPGERFPRVRELAEKLEVTLPTLDQALKQLETKGVIIRKKRSGIFVADRVYKKTIGLILGNSSLLASTSSFVSLLLEYCRKRTENHNERFSFYLDYGMQNHEPLQHDLVEAVNLHKLDGILLASHREELEEWIRNHHIPTVSLGRNTRWPNRVILDGEHLTYLGVNKLIEQGCKSVGIISATSRHMDLYRRVMSKIGMPIKEQWIVNREREDIGNESAGVKCAEQFLKQNGIDEKWTEDNTLPDGVIITDDMMTRGACAVFMRKGILPGKQIRIASHGNKGSWALAEWESNLVVCEYDPQEVVESMFSMLESLIAGQTLNPSEVYIRPKIKADKRTGKN